MLPPAPVCCHSTARWPIGAGLTTSCPPPRSLQSIWGSVQQRSSEYSFFLLSLSPAAPLSFCPSSYNGERRTVGCVSAVLELQRVCGHSHPEGWYVPLWHSEWRFHSGRGRRWNLQSALPAQTHILLQVPLHPALCKYTFITSHLRFYSNWLLLYVIHAQTAEAWSYFLKFCRWYLQLW